MKKINFLESLQIENNIGRIEEIIKSGILSNAASIDRSPFSESALIEFLIRLNDLLQKCKSLDIEIIFSNDIPKNWNITNLISRLRNSACHINSMSRLIDNEIPFCFNIIGPLATIKYGNWITNKYSDDIIFCYGNNFAYLNRHLIRAYNEAKKELKKIVAEPPAEWYKWWAFWCAWF